MSSLTPLQQLRHFDRSSARFPSQIVKFLHGQGYRDWVNDIRDDDSSWFVEYLDDVLGTLEPDTLAFWACLRELRAVCGNWRMLPQSHVLPTSHLNVYERPIAARGPYDVYEASLDGAKVWVKRLRIYSTAGVGDVTRDFCQEVIIWKRLFHRNIVPLLGVTVSPFQSVSVWASGGELPDFIYLHPHADRLGLLSDVADGLNYLHSRNITHGDLKGTSIIVDAAGLARLTDFGLSRVASDLGSASSMTDSHAVRWAAPEVLDRERPITKASDIYSFAMVVIEIYSGSAPFCDSTPTAVVIDVLSGCRPSRPTNPDLTDPLWDLTRQCWKYDPQRRPTITEVIYRLRSELASRRVDRSSLNDATLTAFRPRESFNGPHSKPSHLAAVSHKLRRFLGFSKASTPQSPSNSPRTNGSWFSRDKSRFGRSWQGRPSASRFPSSM